MYKKKSGSLSFLILLLTISCNKNSAPSFRLSGSIDYIGDSELYVEVEPLHYKYSPKEIYPIDVTVDGTFELEIPMSEDKDATLKLDDNQLPLILSNQEQTIKIKRADFPQGVEFETTHNASYQAYQNYLSATEGIDSQIDTEMRAYREGLDNKAIALSLQKIKLAEKYLKDTEFSSLILKAEGEYLVNRIKSVEYRFYNPQFNADAERKAVLDEALELGFFTLASLEAQRAGIRDFTHYYARTFGIYYEVLQEFKLDLSEIDIKRLAYDRLNNRRLEVLEYIEDRQARAYASMFLVAERIGELPLETARPSYERYMDEYADLTEYTSFLKTFYEDIKSVSPGQPAIPFTLTDDKGVEHSMSEYAGKYVLLDFWAGWCQPCIQEFSHMRRIYEKYPREDFEILGISTEVDKEVWRYDINRFKNPWVQLYGGNGFNQETFKAYKGGGIPFYILIGPDGNILQYNDVRASFNLDEVLSKLID